MTFSHDLLEQIAAWQSDGESAALATVVKVYGSRRTHAARCDELRKLGASKTQIERILAPIGLNLGGRRPEEIALAITAEIVAAEHGTGDDS